MFVARPRPAPIRYACLCGELPRMLARISSCRRPLRWRMSSQLATLSWLRWVDLGNDVWPLMFLPLGFELHAARPEGDCACVSTISIEQFGLQPAGRLAAR